MTSDHTWEGIGGGTVTVISVAPRIVSVSFDKEFIEPGAWVTLTVMVTNDGPDTVPIQTVQIGLPFDPPISDVEIVSTDLNWGAEKYPKGSLLGSQYGNITSKYPIVEGWQRNFVKGDIRTLKIRVKFPDASMVTFDVKTVACTEDWTIITSDPKSGMVDQQGEYTRPYLILKKFSITMAPTDSVDVSIPIINRNRYPPKGAPSQPNIVVQTFTVTDKDGFDGAISAVNLPLTVKPGETATLKVRVSTSNHPRGTYTISYKITGSP